MQVTLVDCPGHASLIRTIIGGKAIQTGYLLVTQSPFRSHSSLPISLLLSLALTPSAPLTLSAPLAHSHSLPLYSSRSLSLPHLISFRRLLSTSPPSISPSLLSPPLCLFPSLPLFLPASLLLPSSPSLSLPVLPFSITPVLSCLHRQALRS